MKMMLHSLPSLNLHFTLKKGQLLTALCHCMVTNPSNGKLATWPRVTWNQPRRPEAKTLAKNGLTLVNSRNKGRDLDEYL